MTHRAPLKACYQAPTSSLHDDWVQVTVHSDSVEHLHHSPSHHETQATMETHEPPQLEATSIPSPDQTEHLEAFKLSLNKYSKQQAIFATLRERALLLRDQVAYERKEYWRQRDHVRDSLQEAVSKFSQFPDTKLAKEVIGEIWEQKERVAKDQLSLDQQTETLRKLEDQLSTVEFKMQRYETRLAECAAHAMSQLKALNILEESHTAPESMASGQNTPSAEATGARTPPLNPILQDFYDKAGWLRILHYRLVDLNQFHAEERARRVLADDQGRPSDTSWDVFEADYRREQEQLQQDLNDAIVAEGDARAACFAADLDPDMHKKSVPDTGVVSETQDLVQQQQDHAITDVPADLLEAVAPEREFVPSMPDDKHFPMLSAIGDDAFTSIVMDQVPAEETYQRIDDWLQDDDFKPAMDTWIDPAPDTRPDASRTSSGGLSLNEDGSWVKRRTKAGTSRNRPVLAQKSGPEQTAPGTRDIKQSADFRSTSRPINLVRRLSESDYLSQQSRKDLSAPALIDPESRHAAMQLLRREPLAQPATS